MKSPLLAIDFAVLLPNDTRQLAERLNAATRKSNDDLTLDADHLPHITLVQQFIRVDILRAAGDAVDRILQDTPALDLQIAGVEKPSETIALRIERSADIQQLHERLLTALAPFDERQGDAEAFANGVERARPRDVEYVTSFRTASSYEKYSPHVTLGQGALPAPIQSLHFRADRIAACQLGRFCTCRVILRDWKLLP